MSFPDGRQTPQPPPSEARKRKVLDVLYEAFARWCAPVGFCCTAGCATCCTRHVTITALEGRRILDHCLDHEPAEFLAERLAGLAPGAVPLQTTNEYVGSMLRQAECLQEQPRPHGPCPFLSAGICTIYAVRPFSCRCFSSTSPCRGQDTASVPEIHIVGALVVMQLIEHLGQSAPWGYMVDVLVLLLQRPEYDGLVKATNHRHLLEHARRSLRRAQPLAGFVGSAVERQKLEALLNGIFSTVVDGQTVEEILNGR